MVMSSSLVRLVKRPRKEISKEEKQKNILGKLIMGKEEKGFDVVECHLKDNKIEYSNSFPLGFALVKDILVSMDRFKRAPLKIVYCPLLKAHVNEIKTRIIVHNKFDTKVPIFTIPKDQDRREFIFPRAPRTWEEIKDLQVFIVGGQHMIVAAKVGQLNFTIFHLFFF
jgi:hypothetical protein